MKITWTVSNFISAFRLVLSIPLYFSFVYKVLPITIIIIVFAFISDLSDGFLARKRNEISEFGKILDPLADKIFIFVFILSLLMINEIPLWFFLVIISRDIIILIAGLFVIKYKREIPYSNKFGKLAVLVIGSTLFFITIKVFSRPVIDVFIILSIIMVVGSLLNYFIKFIITLKTR